jgi:benzoyl-CoA reductase/2-hydroxyglutaryl-CoA dehydratase subunit BcrC/BadD/HgdB
MFVSGNQFKGGNMDALWDELVEDMLNPLVQQAIDAGRVPLGYTCLQAPLPLMSIGKLFPLAVRAPGVSTTELADVYLSSVICPFTRSLQEFQMQGSYYFLGGLVIPCACDHIRRFNDHLDLLKTEGDNLFNYCLDVPRKDGDLWIDFFAEDLRSLAGQLSERFGVEINDELLRAEIVKLNEFNALVKEISDLRLADEPLISGTEFLKLMVGCHAAPRDLLLEPLKRLKDQLASKKSGHKGRARLMVMGNKLDSPDYIRAIESQGAVVVADRHCLGALPNALAPIKVAGDPYQNLAEHILTTSSCPRMMEKFDERLEDILRLVKDYQVDGIIIECIKFCDIWYVDTVPLLEALREAGVPVMRLEREYRHTGEGQLITRVQAFLESIESRRINRAMSK